MEWLIAAVQRWLYGGMAESCTPQPTPRVYRALIALAFMFGIVHP
jgi:hypothetical protein